MKIEGKRNIFLFGAGAAIDWGAPCTPDLTEKVLESGFNINDNKTRITKFIYDKLKDSGRYSNDDINFETVINVIEELIVYYSYFNTEKRLPSLLSSFFKPCHENELLHFTRDGGEIKDGHPYKLNIPGQDAGLTRIANPDIAPNQFFFQQLLFSVLTQLSFSIEKTYALHTINFPKVLENEKMKKTKR